MYPFIFLYSKVCKKLSVSSTSVMLSSILEDTKREGCRRSSARVRGVDKLLGEKYKAFSGPYFPAFGLNTEIYPVKLRIQSECRKIRTRKNTVF